MRKFVRSSVFDGDRDEKARKKGFALTGRLAGAMLCALAMGTVFFAGADGAPAPQAAIVTAEQQTDEAAASNVLKEGASAGTVCETEAEQDDFAADVQRFEVGPGITEAPGAILDGGDSYLKYQWGLHNYGQLQVDAAYLKNTEYRLSGEPNISADAAKAAGIKTAVSGVDIEMQAAWALYEAKADKRQVVVAVIDTGVDFSHPELADAAWVNADEIAGDGIDNDGNGYIDDINGWNFVAGNAKLVESMAEDYHGTHGAATIAAKRGNGGIAGITDNQYVKIMSLKVLGARGGGSDAAVVEAIHYAEENGADICNLSFGGYNYSQEVADAIQNSKMLFVAAAGNGNRWGVGFSIDERPVYPAALPADNLLAVSNLMFDGNLHTSSNYGAASVDLAAPGSYILSAIPNGKFAFLSGTSMAAPYVTGVAAMAYSYRTDLALSDIKALLLRNAKPLERLSGTSVTGGMVDAYHTLLDDHE